MNTATALTPYQAIDIVTHIEGFLAGIDPPWELNLHENEWELVTQDEVVSSFPLIPSATDLKHLVRRGCESAPEEQTVLWKSYLTFLAEVTIPHAFERVGVAIG